MHVTVTPSAVTTADLLLETAVLHHLRAHHTADATAEVLLDATALALWMTRYGSTPTMGQLCTVLDTIAETAEHALIEHAGDAASAIADQARALEGFRPLLPIPQLPAPAPLPDLVMPEGYQRHTFSRTPAALAHVEACTSCTPGEFGPPHWPSEHCGGGNAPGRPIRTHCTCDGCF